LRADDNLPATDERRRGMSIKTTTMGVLLAAAAVGALGAVPASASADRQYADVYTLAGLPGAVDVGDSTLIRTERGVTAVVKTTGLLRGPHTMWWVVWNNPRACGADGCNEADLGNPETGVDIGYAAGVVVGDSGRAAFTAYLPQGSALGGFPSEFGIASGSGLIDAHHAEIHLVVRSHGPRIAGLVREMTHTFHAGCDYSVFGGLIAEGSYGTAGPNTCTDLLFAVHP
jgi:hypothetical protein